VLSCGGELIIRDMGWWRKIDGMANKSEYEAMFGVRHRPPGRPTGGDGSLFPRGGVSELVGRVAERRAYAVIHEKYRDELARVYRAECAVLSARGDERVQADIASAVTDSTRKSMVKADG
jgi:hypothetical protein